MPGPWRRRACSVPTARPIGSPTPSGTCGAACWSGTPLSGRARAISRSSGPLSFVKTSAGAQAVDLTPRIRTQATPDDPLLPTGQDCPRVHCNWDRGLNTRTLVLHRLEARRKGPGRVARCVAWGQHAVAVAGCAAAVLVDWRILRSATRRQGLDSRFAILVGDEEEDLARFMREDTRSTPEAAAIDSGATIWAHHMPPGRPFVQGASG
jgi:hypothetical protein